MYHIQFMNANLEPRIMAGTLLSGTSMAVWVFNPMLFPKTPGVEVSEKRIMTTFKDIPSK